MTARRTRSTTREEFAERLAAMSDERRVIVQCMIRAIVEEIREEMSATVSPAPGIDRGDSCRSAIQGVRA